MTEKEYKKFTLEEMGRRTWRTTRVIENRGGDRMAVGTVVEIVGKHNGLTISTPRCEHCKVSVLVRGLRCYDVEEITE